MQWRTSWHRGRVAPGSPESRPRCRAGGLLTWSDTWTDTGLVRWARTASTLLCCFTFVAENLSVRPLRLWEGLNQAALEYSFLQVSFESLLTVYKFHHLNKRNFPHISSYVTALWLLSPLVTDISEATFQPGSLVGRRRPSSASSPSGHKHHGHLRLRATLQRTKCLLHKAGWPSSLMMS